MDDGLETSSVEKLRYGHLSDYYKKQDDENDKYVGMYISYQFVIYEADLI